MCEVATIAAVAVFGSGWGPQLDLATGMEEARLRLYSSRYFENLLRDCLHALWTLKYQPYAISFEQQILERVRDLNVYVAR